MYLKRIQQLIDAIKASSSNYKEDDLKFISTVFESCSTYMRAVMLTETARMSVRFTFNDPKDYQTYFSSVDSARTSAHNAAMSNLKMMNKLCSEYNSIPIFTDKEMSLPRAEMADKLIKSIVVELFDERVR